jgi:beta-1,4-mannosyl-glycoprotein beta-1,4-N-acetylglucosaminyltransferase
MPPPPRVTAEHSNRLVAEFPRTKRARPAVVMDGFPFVAEFDLLEIRIQELWDVVDFHVLVESPYNHVGLENRDRFARYAHKILYVGAGKVEGGGGGAWAQENFLRRQIARGLPPLAADDIVLVTDADEILSRDLVYFLKHYEGFPPTLRVSLRWSYYGFFWLNPRDTVVGAVATGAALAAHGNDTHWIRTASGPVVGSRGSWAGWHCSWCFPLETYAVKVETVLEIVQTYKGKVPMSLEFFNESRRTGRWLDGSHDGVMTRPGDPLFAPVSATHFRYLLSLSSSPSSKV